MHELKLGKFRLRPDWHLKLDDLIAKTQSLRNSFLEGEYETEEKEEDDEREEEEKEEDCLSKCDRLYGNHDDISAKLRFLCRAKCAWEHIVNAINTMHEAAMAGVRNMQA
jgi:hypothetical protein